MKIGRILRVVQIALRLLVPTMGFICIVVAVFSKKTDDIGRVFSLITGVWILSMEVFERRLKSIDESLTMMAMAATTKDIVAMIEQAHSKMKEMKRHGAETGNGAKAAQEEGDEFNTTAKTGAHE